MGKYWTNKTVLDDGTVVDEFEINYDIVELTWNCVSPYHAKQVFAGARLNGIDITEERAKEVIEAMKKND